MNNAIVHFVSPTYQALKALTVAFMTLIHSIKKNRKKDTTLNNYGTKQLLILLNN